MQPKPTRIKGDEVSYEEMDAAKGLRKAVLIGEEQRAPNFYLRRFRLDPGAEVPRHINSVEHEQYVLSGGYVIGINGEEFIAETGDSFFIPSGTPHWYRNTGDEAGEFLCIVPNRNDEMEILS